ncbi:GyrI-like domain-containing protein [Chloroflexota bacterium]
MQNLSPVPSHCRYYGIRFYADDGSADESLYMSGIRARATDSRHHAWADKTIPAHRYATFTHKGRARDLNLTLDYAFHTWLPKSGEAIAYPCVIEHHGHRAAGEGDPDTELPVSIPIMPVAR